MDYIQVILLGTFVWALECLLKYNISFIRKELFLKETKLY